MTTDSVFGFDILRFLVINLVNGPTFVINGGIEHSIPDSPLNTISTFGCRVTDMVLWLGIWRGSAFVFTRIVSKQSRVASASPRHPHPPPPLSPSYHDDPSRPRRIRIHRFSSFAHPETSPAYDNDLSTPFHEPNDSPETSTSLIVTAPGGGHVLCQTNPARNTPHVLARIRYLRRTELADQVFRQRKISKQRIFFRPTHEWSRDNEWSGEPVSGTAAKDRLGDSTKNSSLFHWYVV